MSFTSEDWNLPKEINVQTDADDDELNDIVTVMHEVRNYGNYVVNAITDVVEVTLEELELELLVDTLAPLGVPTELTGAVQRGVIILRWRPPVLNEDGRVPTSYEYRYTPTVLNNYDSQYSSGMGWKRAGGITTLSLRVSGLINQAEYTFQVRGVDAALLAEAGSDENLIHGDGVPGGVRASHAGLLRAIGSFAPFVGAAQ